MKKSLKKLFLITFLVLGAATIAVTGFVIRNGRIQQPVAEAEENTEGEQQEGEQQEGEGEAEENQGQVPGIEKEAVNVAVRVLEPESVEETFTMPGTLEAWEDLTLSLEQSGPIVWIGPNEGDRLKAGDEILRIDKDALLAQHAKNETDFDIRKK